MTSRKLTLALLGSVVTAGMLFAAHPASAAVDFRTTSWTVGGVEYEIDNSGSDGKGGFRYVKTPTYSNYSWYSEYSVNFYGGGFSGYNGSPKCLSATATEVTESNGDVVITCQPFQMSPTDVWFTHSYRMYADNMLARHTFTLDNRGTTTLTGLNDSGNTVDWELDNTTLIASSGNPTSCASLTSSDNWIMGSSDSDSTIAGYAWQAKGGSAFDFGGDDCTNGGNSSTFVKADLAAGEKVTYMTFVATGEPAGTTAGEMTTAFEAFKAQMASFDELNDTLCRGIDDGTVIEGWGTCGAPAPNPGLPDTGVSAPTAIALGAAGAGLLMAGIITLIALRRRQARS
jgi:LPXTG-motif cell wall-anchored protein